MQRGSQDPEVRENVVLVQRLGQLGVVERELPQLGREPQGVGRRGLVLEPARVGDEAGVQAHGHLGGNLAAHELDQSGHILHHTPRPMPRAAFRERAAPFVRIKWLVPCTVRITPANKSNTCVE